MTNENRYLQKEFGIFNQVHIALIGALSNVLVYDSCSKKSDEKPMNNSLRKLTQSEILIYITIDGLCYANKTNLTGEDCARVSFQDLSEFIGISRQQIAISVSSLVNNGFIIKSECNAKSKRKYTLNQEKKIEIMRHYKEGKTKNGKPITGFLEKLGVLPKEQKHKNCQAELTETNNDTENLSTTLDSYKESVNYT